MKVVIIEDHLIMRDVLRRICEENLCDADIGEANNGSDAVELVSRSRPDLILLDLVLPKLDGFEVLSRIRSLGGCTPQVLLISGFLDAYSAYRIQRANVQGFVDKRTSSVTTIRDAVVAVAEGRSFFSETFNATWARLRLDPHAFYKLLTDQERRVLLLIGELISDNAIARRLRISVRTVETHRCANYQIIDTR